jgi:uncharacterized repeat protein (TIGR01451 family)/fimbrial isopeptide formation D2 family protein
MNPILRTLFQVKSRLTASAALFAVTALTSVAAHAVCNVDNFSNRLQSTGTTPFNTGDVCTPGGTAHTAGNDACTTDNVVRTSDTYIYRTNFGVKRLTRENNVTIRSTLPLVSGRKVAVWDALPPTCTGPGSLISPDGLTLTCNVGDIDRTAAGPDGTGAYAGALLAQVKSTVYGANGDQITNVPVSVSSDNCTAVDLPPQTFPVVEISARQKVDFRKDSSLSQSAYSYNGVPGYLLSYYVYMDQYDPSGSALGGQALNSPILLKDFAGLTAGPASSPWPAGSVWFDCYDASGLQGTLTCPASGTVVQNGVSQDLVLTARPEEVGEFMIAGGRNTALGRDRNTSSPQRLSTFVARFFVPLAAINSAGGQLNLKNSIPAANIVGTDLSGAPIVDVRPENNEIVVTVVGNLPGGLYKYVAAEWPYIWSGPVPGQAGSGYRQLQGTDYFGDSGTGLIFPGQYFYPRLDYYNPDALVATNVRMCEAFDSAKVRLAEISSLPGHAAADIYATSANRGQPDATRFPRGYVTEYGVAATQGGPGVNSRCDDTDATWYPDLNAAAAAGNRERINRVRMTVPEVGVGQSMYFMIAQQARPNVNGTIIDDYYSAKASNMRGSNGTQGDWVLSSYDKVTNNGVGLGKRFTLVTSIARVVKEASLTETGTNINSGAAGGTVVYKLNPSVQTAIVNPPATYITIEDTLPPPLEYVVGSAKYNGVVRDPDSISQDASGTKLTWTINNVTPNQTLPALTFVARIPRTIPPNSIKTNSVVISSPDDTSPLAQRTAIKALTIINSPGFYVNKRVLAPKIDPNGTVQWNLQISNFEDSPIVVDVIDVLPYNADGRQPVTTFTGTRRLSAAVVVGGGATVRYTSRASASVVSDPEAAGNTPTTSAGWCLESEFNTPGCPTDLSTVTAFRASGASIGANATLEIDYQMPTQGNSIDNVYTNQFFAKSNDIQLRTLQSNDVRAVVALGSIAGKVYVDTDRTATQNGAADIAISGVPITLCLVAPVNGLCPAGQVAINPLTNQPLQTVTGVDGSYKIEGIPSSPLGGYFVVETKPASYGNGPNNAAGSLGGTSNTNNYSAVVLPVGANGTNYNFGHTAVDLNTTVTLPTGGVSPTAPVNASVRFGNASLTDGENTVATLTLNPGLTGVVITPPAGWTITTPYDPVTGKVTLAPTGGIFAAGAIVDVPVVFNAPETGTVRLRSDITNSIADVTPIVDPTSTAAGTRNAHQASVGVLAQSIDVLKRVGTPRELTFSELTALSLPITEKVFAVPYRVIVANRGLIASTNVQAVDQLTDTFPAPATIARVQQVAPQAVPTGTGIAAADALGAKVYNSAVGSAASATQCAANASAFNGSTQQKLLAGNFDLAPTEQCLVEFAVIVRYPTAAQVPTAALKNSVYASSVVGGVNNGPTIAAGVPTYPAGTKAQDISTDSPQVPPGTVPGSGFPTDFPTPPASYNDDTPDPTPVSFSGQAIDVTKASSFPVQLDVSGKRFRIAYTVNLSNAAQTVATNVQLTENLKFTFPAPATFSVVPNSVAIAAPAAGTNACVAADLNTAFDGGAAWTGSGTPNHNLLGTNGLSSKNLAVGEQCVVTFTVDVNYGSATVPSTGSLNTVFASSSDPTVPNGGPPMLANGTKNGDNPAMVSKDTSSTVNPPAATRPYGTTPADPGKPAAGPKSDVGAPTVTPSKTLEVVKSVNGSGQIIALGKYKVPYKVRVEAIGTAGEVLPNVQAIDNLTQTFDRDNNGVPSITVQNRATPVSIAGAVCPANFNTFTGLNSSPAGQRFMPGNTPLTVGQACEFNFDVVLDYGSTEPELGPHYNSVFASSVPAAALVGGINPGGTIALNPTQVAPLGSPSPGTSSGTWTPPAGAIAKDASTDATAVPSSQAGDTPTPTVVRFSAAPPVSGIKFVENLSLPGTAVVAGQQIQWTIAYKNEGGIALTKAQVTDTMQAGLTNASIVSITRNPATPGGPIVANSAYTGAAANNQFFATPITLGAGEIVTIKVKATIADGFVGTINNQANLSAEEYGGPNGTLTPTSAVNPGAPACENVKACVPAGITVPAKALISQPEGNTDPKQPNVLKVIEGGSISGVSWFDGDKNGQIGGDERRVQGLKVGVFAVDSATGELIGEVTTPTTRPVTNERGEYKVSGLAPSTAGITYQVVFYNEQGAAVLGQPSPMANGNPNNGQLPATGAKDKIVQVKVAAGQDTPAQNLPLDPSGVVYDAVTRQVVPGAVVAIEGPAGFNPAIHLQGGTANVNQTTGATGLYQYILLSGAPAGTYRLSVTPPAGYTVPSTLIPAQTTTFTPPNGPGTTFRVQPQSTAPQIATNDPTIYYMSFNLTVGASADVVNNHIPLDPIAQPRIALSKTVNKATAEIGDVVTYALRVRNIGQSALPNAIINDRLPAGFKYIPGTAQMSNPSGAAVRSIADPIGGAGPALVFTAPTTIVINSESTIYYKVRIGVGSLQGDGINRATARSGNIVSNEARAKVKLIAGVFTNEACVVGKVYVDCNNNHVQDAEELGIPSVRLYLQDGTKMITDSEGKYSYCGLPANSSVLKLDILSMPRGSRVTTTSNRNLGDGNSLYLDSKGGQQIRADFAEGSCSNTVLEQVKARRTQGEVRSVQTEKKGQPAKKFEGKSAAYPQQGTDSANQPLVKPRLPNTGGPSTSEENTPVPALPSASSNTRGSNLRDGK